LASFARGHRLGSRYRIEEALARGGMGAVYRAVDERRGRDVAIKVMHKELAEGTVEVARFEREALAAASLHHPGIVQVLGVGKEPDGTSYLVMELVRGETLAALLTREGKVAPARAADIVEQALFALSVAHGAGVIHRDLKPGNVMLTSIDGRETVKVLDFGVAQLKAGASYTRLTKTGVLVGTPAFMAPEQARGEPSDARTDVYAMGVLLWSLCTGRAPFMAPDLADILLKVLNDKAPRADAVEPTVPAALASIIEMAMQKRPEDRFASASAFASALVDLRTREGGGVVASSPRAPLPAPWRSAPRPAAVSPTADDSGVPPHRRIALVILGVTAVVVVGMCLVGGALALYLGLYGARDPVGSAEPERTMCARAADCCLQIAAGDASATASCEALRGRDPLSGDGCASALAAYHDALARMGRDTSACE
jgi:serine/threonine-protein kinase